MVTVRTARPDDLPKIYEITYRAWDGYTLHQMLEERHGVIGGKGWRERKVEEVRRFCERNPEGVLVAEEDGVVVGYATFGMDEDGVGHVLNNAVDPEHRGRGIGTALVRAVVERLKAEGARILRVTTLESDIPARRVYEKLGFVELARSVHYTMEVG